MPRYFFHTDDGEIAFRDSEGLELADEHAARAAGIAALPDMARDKLPDGDHQVFTVLVENDMGSAVYEAVLELKGRWRSGPATTL